MYKKYLALSLALTLPTMTAVASQPLTCPQVPVIQQVGLNQAVNKGWEGWGATYSPSHKYGTDFDWGFWLFTDDSANEAKDDNEVLQKANLSLRSLKYYTGPITNDEHTTICLYSTDNVSIIGVISNPPIIPDMNSLKRIAR